MPEEENLLEESTPEETASGETTSEDTVDLTGIEADLETLISQNQQLILQVEQTNIKLQKTTDCLCIMICFLVAAALVYAFKAFSRFLNNFF